MLTVTFIRHGESEDNLKDIWAGWKDAPLSPLGRKQACALGQAFASVKIDHLYASPLKRALSTAQAVDDAHQDRPLAFTINPNLREQCFGVAEGHMWLPSAPPGTTLEQLYKGGKYPTLRGRDARFDQGESLNNLARRTEQAVRECVLPHLVKEDDGGNLRNIHVALASHGLAISEMVAALLRLDPEFKIDRSYSGLANTAWTRVRVGVRDPFEGPIDVNNPPPLVVEVLDINNKDHLKDLFKKLKVAGPLPDEQDTSNAAAKAFFSGHTDAKGLPVVHDSQVSSAST